MTTTGALPVHRPNCEGDPAAVSSRIAAFSSFRAVVRMCDACGAVALERIHDRKDTQ